MCCLLLNSLTPVFIPKWYEYICPSKDMYKNVFSNVIHLAPNWNIFQQWKNIRQWERMDNWCMWWLGLILQKTSINSKIQNSTHCIFCLYGLGTYTCLTGASAGHMVTGRKWGSFYRSRDNLEQWYISPRDRPRQRAQTRLLHLRACNLWLWNFFFFFNSTVKYP